MERKDYIIIGMFALVLIISIVQAFQIRAIKDTGMERITGSAIDTSGWTETEKMNYEHHGTLPVRLQGSIKQGPAQSQAMVGGC